MASSICWLAAVTVSPDNTVSFTPQAAMAIEAIFRILDADGSNGLDFDEVTTYFWLTEDLDLSRDQFIELDLATTHNAKKKEISLEGFQDIYRCVYEEDVSQGDARLRQDLDKFGIAYVMQVQQTARNGEHGRTSPLLTATQVTALSSASTTIAADESTTIADASTTIAADAWTTMTTQPKRIDAVQVLMSSSGSNKQKKEGIVGEEKAVPRDDVTNKEYKKVRTQRKSAVDATSLLMKRRQQENEDDDVILAYKSRSNTKEVVVIGDPSSVRPAIDATKLLMRRRDPSPHQEVLDIVDDEDDCALLTKPSKAVVDATSLLMKRNSPVSDDNVEVVHASTSQRKPSAKDATSLLMTRSSGPKVSKKRVSSSTPPPPLVFQPSKNQLLHVSDYHDGPRVVFPGINSNKREAVEILDDDDDDVQLVGVDDAPIDLTSSTSKAPPSPSIPAKIHPFFLQQQRPRTGSGLVPGFEADDPVPPSSTFAPLLKTLKLNGTTDEFPMPSLSTPFSNDRLMRAPSPPMVAVQRHDDLVFPLSRHSEEIWSRVQGKKTASTRLETVEEEDSVMIDNNAEESKRFAWTERHRPKGSRDLLGSAGAINSLRSWLTAWLVEKSRTDSEMTSEEEEEEDLAWSDDDDNQVDGRMKKSLILFGPSGAGKTCSLYTVAEELGFRVFEVNASDDRSRIKQLIGEASQSYGLSKSGRSLELPLILVDEFDSGFDDDPNFLGSLRSLVRTARAPVVFICDDQLPRHISPNGTELDPKLFPVTDVLRFERPSTREVLRKLAQVLRMEGVQHENEEEISSLARAFKGDLRKCIQHVHFWRGVAPMMTSKPVGVTGIITVDDDGIAALLSTIQPPPQVFRIKPRKLNQASEEFEIVGRFLSSTTRVLVDEMECPASTILSDTSLRTRLVVAQNQEQVAKASSSSSSEEEGEEELSDFHAPGDVDDDFDDFEPSPPPKKKNKKSTMTSNKKSRLSLSGSGKQQRRLRLNIVVETYHPILLPNKMVTVCTRSDQDLQFRYNSLYWCLDETSLPPPCAYAASPVMTVSVSASTSTASTPFRPDVARANIEVLNKLAYGKDLASIAECVKLSRRARLRRDDDDGEMSRHWKVEEEYSLGDDLGLQLSEYLSQADDVDDEPPSTAYVTTLRSLQLATDRDALWVTIPLLVRMARLDELRRVGHTGRRTYMSYFRLPEWAQDSARTMAKLGMEDLDLGWRSAVDQSDAGEAEEARAQRLISEDDDEDFIQLR